MAAYDAIVLGVGGVGSSALYHLAARGARVLGIDRFPPGHDQGSSHGQTRVIRQAYFEHPNYVPLVQRAFELWRQLEQRTDTRLYDPVGLLEIGPPQGEVIRGVRESAALHGLDIENLSADEAMARFPAFRVPHFCEAVFERQAGYLLVEQCVQAHIQAATNLGAKLHIGDAVCSWRVDGDAVRVVTDRATFTADRLIIAAGAWSSQVLSELRIPLVVLRKPLYWWRTRSDVYRADRGCPGFLYELPHGVFYGVPQIDELGVKAAEHTGGELVTDPLDVRRTIELSDQQHVASFLTEHLIDATSDCTNHTVCMYTMTPDSNFIVDRHPAHSQVSFAAGLSGHGFKFSCVLGEALSQLALDGQTELPIEFLSVTRPALTLRKGVRDRRDNFLK